MHCNQWTYKHFNLKIITGNLSLLYSWITWIHFSCRLQKDLGIQNNFGLLMVGFVHCYMKSRDRISNTLSLFVFRKQPKRKYKPCRGQRVCLTPAILSDQIIFFLFSKPWLESHPNQIITHDHSSECQN